MADTKSLKGTKTEINLAMSYIAESTAVTRYTYYSQQATKENYFHFSRIFAETAENELHHGKVFLKFLKEATCVPGPVQVDMGQLGDTLTNLKIAASEEQKEGVELYTAFAKVARKEGFDKIASQFEAIASVEARHEEQFLKMASQIEKGTVWSRPEPIRWQCDVCGYIHEGTEPPKECPGCLHPQSHFFPEYGI